MTFRPATLADTDLLYRWRLEDEARGTREGWRRGTETAAGDHEDWLIRRLANPLVHILIWEDCGEPIGTLRIDSNGEVAWHGSRASAMLKAAAEAYADQYGGRLKAVIDHGDTTRYTDLTGAAWNESPVNFFTGR